MGWKKAKFLFFSIIILAIVLRVYKLGKIPNGLEWDEVALGYDAYSILHTGRDYFGNFLPLTFRSLDDYKPPLYVYADVIPVFLLGLTEFSTRLPTALFGIVGVILTYYLVLELLREVPRHVRVKIALLAALFLAVSPWHLQFSRAAFETNLSVTVTIAAVLFFYRGIFHNPKEFLLSALFFGIALFSYHSTRVVTPLLLLSLFIILHKSLPSKRYLVGFFLIYSVFVYLFIPILRSPEAQIRFRVTNALNLDEAQTMAAEQIKQDEGLNSLIGGKIFHNRRLSLFNYSTVQKLVENHLKHFSPEFLFVKGDVPLHHAPGFGMMYFFDAVFLPLGILFFLLRLRSRYSAILLLWLLYGPLPASVTFQVPHAVRAEIILPSLQIFSAVGLFFLYDFIRKESRLYALGACVFISVLFMYGAGAYLHQYYIHTDIELSKYWLYGRKEAVEYTEKVKSQYDTVIVSPHIDMPYIFWLYYSRYSPKTLQMEKGIHSGGFAEERNKFSKYEFRPFSYSDSKRRNDNVLLVGTPADFPVGIKKEKVIKYIDHTEAIYIVDPQKN